MSCKNTKQNPLTDALLVQHKSLTEPDDIHNIINWNELEKTLSNLYSSKRDAPSYPPLMMFKRLILQTGYNLTEVKEIKQEKAR